MTTVTTSPPNNASLKNHTKKEHSEKTLLFPCDDCESRFATKKGLTGHNKSKHPEYASNLLNINVTTPHPIKESKNKKRKLETTRPEIEEHEESIVIEDHVKVEVKEIETQTEEIITKNFEVQGTQTEDTPTASEDFLNSKLKEMVIDRNKWQGCANQAMNKLQASELHNVRLRDENSQIKDERTKLIEYCNSLKVENRKHEEVIMGEKWMRENVDDNDMSKDDTLKETEDMDVTIRCSKCDYEVKSVEDMEKHKETHKCEHCDFQFKDEIEKQAHMTGSHPAHPAPTHPAPTAPPLEDLDEMFTCDDCDFQTVQFQHLLEHIETRHKVATVHVENTDKDLFKCKDCNNKFPNYDSLMKHRKQKHPKPCRNFPKGSCRFEKEECYWVHPETMEVTESVSTEGTSQPQSETPFKCHTCNDNFTSKNAMM